ncbi:MAG: hypothetical protein N3B21_01475 [Clostridia bacterium]|nr:hypothetical protein [Clostridia bacterium]
MQLNTDNGIAKIFTAFSKVHKYPKAIIKYGVQAFLALFLVGTLLFVFNTTKSYYDLYAEFIATSIIKSSFIILAEIVIGALLLDYLFKKN